MTGKTAKTIFWVGTLVSTVIFLWLTYDFHQQERKFVKAEISPDVIEGKKIWHKYNCNDCHTILGFGGYYAPDMTKAYYRLGENNIIAIVTNPDQVYKNSFRKMPRLGVTKEEATKLVAFLKWVGSIENRNWPPQDEKFVRAFKLREAGAKQISTVDMVMGTCGGCHSFQKQGRRIAGDFVEIARTITFDRDTLAKFILNPQAVKAGSAMPSQNVSPETASQIADFILSLKPGKEVQK